MALPEFLDRLIPPRLRKDTPVVHVVRLKGAIGMGSPLQPSLNAKDLEPLFKRAFTKRAKAVALVINSPGGSAVQSALIHDRIRDLAQEHKLPVYAFVEDVAASGGYWLACAGDEIYADGGSIVGSIGVIYSGFGFQDALAKLGIERRVHTAGENKAILDPFRPEKKEDVDRLLSLQSEIHQNFKAHVRTRRAGKLKEDDPELFTGAFWVGSQAMARGLIDGLGHLHAVLKQKFGEKVVLKSIAPSQGFGLRRLGFGTIDALPDALLDAAQVRALWSRYGL
jgi:signal peptide peptidase SppA